MIARNVTGRPVGIVNTVIVPTNTLWMDPESGSVSVLFTAPSTGTYTIAGIFLTSTRSQISHPVSLLDDGTVVWTGTIAKHSGASLTEELSKN